MKIKILLWDFIIPPRSRRIRWSLNTKVTSPAHYYIQLELSVCVLPKICSWGVCYFKIIYTWVKITRKITVSNINPALWIENWNNLKKNCKNYFRFLKYWVKVHWKLQNLLVQIQFYKIIIWNCNFWKTFSNVSSFLFKKPR